MTTGKTLVLISSSGGAYGDTNPRDHLTPYLREVFAMVGYEKCLEIKIQGASQLPRDKLLQFAEQRAAEISNTLNEEYSARRP